MVEEQYVSFKTAKLLKEKGFVDEYGEGYYTKKGKIQFQQLLSDLIEKEETYYCDAPTQQIVMRWLREEHNIHIAIVIGTDVDNPNYIFYLPSIAKFSKANIKYIDPFGEDEFDSCEQAVEAAIQYCLKNLL